MSSTALADRILRFVESGNYKPRELEELALAMGIGEDEQGDFRAACKALMKTGRVVLGAANSLMLPAPTGEVIGTFRANPRGFGFVIPQNPDSPGDLYVSPGNSGGAITGDTVCARVIKRGKRRGRMLFEGRVIEIISRGQNRFVGELVRQGSSCLVIPDGNTLHVPIMVADTGAGKCRPGAQVVVEITRYPDKGKEAQGVLVKVLGKRGEPAVDTASIIEQYQFPEDFDESVLADARRALERHDPAGEMKRRKDLRGLTVVTIDPPDARDFDDAISLSQEPDGTTVLGVHIADVAHYVECGRAVDREARARSTSVYLPGKVIPMLPEVLSNGVCSLQERQTRLTKTVFIRYDRRGAVLGTRLANSVIRCTKRLTYQQADLILSGKAGRTSPKVVSLLKGMEKLARAIQRRRIRGGMLVLDLPEVELVRDDDGAVVDAVAADRSFPHTIIEMFMVEANEAVAGLLTKERATFLRRIHERPDASAVQNLRKFLGALGHPLPTQPDLRALQQLLRNSQGKPEAYAVHLAVLRSMQQAEYSPLPVGHYALASANYCHFTSPIRRYPDLTVHRLIEDHLNGAGGGSAARSGSTAQRDGDLVELGRKCSATERRAEAAERELRLVLVLRLLEKHLGQSFAGIVTGVSNVGLFVQLERFLVEGLLRFGDLPDDWWEVDSSRGAVVGERSGRRIRIGDSLQVVISRIHIPTRRLEIVLGERLESAQQDRRQKWDLHSIQDRAQPGRRKRRTKASRAGRTSKTARAKTRPGTRSKRK